MYHLLVEKPVEYLPSTIPIELGKQDEFFFGNGSVRAAPFAGGAMVKTRTSWSSEVSSSATSPLYEILSVKVSHAASPPKSSNATSRLSKGLPRVNKGPSRVSSSPYRVSKDLSTQEPATLEAATPAPAMTTAYHLDDHFLYSLKDFQPFKSKNYFGVLEEIKNWVGPFRDNTKLQDALTTYMKPPQTYERLNDLASYLMELGDAMRSSKTLPTNKHKEIAPIIAAMSEDSEKKLDEISSVIVVAEAECNFPHHIVKKIIELDADKRAKLMEVILQTPYRAEIHAYPGIGPYRDPDLKPIMIRMGFKIWFGTSNLQYIRRVIDEEEDLLIAALIVLIATEK